MDQLINYSEVAPEGMRTLRGLEAYVRSAGLEPGLLELVKTRASQLNQCAYCIDMHTKDARAGGEAEQRLYALSAWRETPFFTDRERAALAWTEAVTHISHGSVPDALYQEARRHFSEKESRGPNTRADRYQRVEPAEHLVLHRAGDLRER